MKTLKEFKIYLYESYSDEQMLRANKTSRHSGAVGEKAVVPKYVEENIPKEHSILDFGAGKVAAHTKRLREKGFNVTAHEFGSNQTEDHDKEALTKKYHTVYASNVLNTQDSPEMLSSTLDSIHKVIHPGGHFIANLPKQPLFTRTKIHGDMSDSEVQKANMTSKFHNHLLDNLHSELSKRFNKVTFHKKQNIFHAEGPK